MEEEQTQPRREGDPAFPEGKEKENSTDSSSEKTDTTPQPDEGKNSDAEKSSDAGFADHPRWKEREDNWKERFNKQEERHAKEIQDALQPLKEEIDEIKKPKRTDNPEIPNWFGGDEQQWKSFQQDREQIAKTAEENAVKRIKAEKDAEQKRIDDATAYFNEQADLLEQEAGEKIDRNKLLKTVLDLDLVDSKGRWNYKAAYGIMKSPEKISDKGERKKLADASASDNKSDTKPPSYSTSADFKGSGRPW
jgi:hypothetical protein